MSDLLPLVAAALNDKIALEVHEELAGLKKDLHISRSVEIIRSRNNGGDEDEDEDVVVYASGQFHEGKYGTNPNLWQVNLEPSGSCSSATSTLCRLVDLRDCHICVGGGFPLASLDDQSPNHAPFDGWLDLDQADGENSKAVNFCFAPHSLWLIIVVHGWPGEAWEAVIESDDLDSEACLSFLVETVASEYPEATVEFKHVSFAVKSIHGALKRLLSPKCKQEVRTERDGQDSEERQAHNDLVHHVISTMREHGDESSSPLICRRLEEVMGILMQLGVHERNDSNERLIDGVIAVYESGGPEEVERLIRQEME